MGPGSIANATFDRLGGILARALDGLSIEQIRKQPAGPESNPIGWMAWHLTRGHDGNFSNLLRRDEAWKSEGWADRFGLSVDIGNASGSTLDEVRAFDPIDAPTLLAYWETARARSREFLDALQEEDLEKITPPRKGRIDHTYTITVAWTTADCAQHIGQIAYARGLVDRHGWYGA
jgi:hypothetical protein